MAKKKIGLIGTALAFALAAGLGTAQVTHTSINNAPTSQAQRSGEMKATQPRKSVSRKIVAQHSGGLDIIHEGGDYGMSPKQYGLSYGNGKSRKVKHNRLRYSHNAKLKRRLNK
jgi:hypothetical protein